MNVLWKGGTRRGGMAQWVFFCAVAAIAGLVILVLVALGLAVGALLIGIISAAAVFGQRRRGRVPTYDAHTAADGRDPGGPCVELDREAYTVRIVDEKTPPAQ
ncbi:MAG: hypothetical protein LBC79_08080 [Deltaproteobacteria bacterium]|jgi:hypothetical protein|nr:hypothetical protein [Deltaproteobacteria bacterium]